MTIPAVHRSRHIYQFTHLANLETILEHGLVSCNEAHRLGIKPHSIASQEIQSRRAIMPVTTGLGGVVHDYVPFYFCTRTPMLLSVVNAKNADQMHLIFFGVSIQELESLSAVFTDAAANSDEHPNFYSDPVDLDKLNWSEIDCPKWGCANKELRRQKMAEALIHECVSLGKIDHIIVWNKGPKKYVEESFLQAGYEVPAIEFDGHLNRYFYFTPFYTGDKASIITGPISLKKSVDVLIDQIKKRQSEEAESEAPAFQNMSEAATVMDDNFCCIPELAEINELDTNNDMHREGVGSHTRSVVKCLTESIGFSELEQDEQAVLKVAAYLHDIGKGKSPRKAGRQNKDPDHPARALPMLERILTEEFKELDVEACSELVRLVAYHDLIGDIVSHGRDREQLLDAVRSPEEFDRLAMLTLADVESLIPPSARGGGLNWGVLNMTNPEVAFWPSKIRAALPELREWLITQLEVEDL